MTKQELVDTLKLLASDSKKYGNDVEQIHIEADKALLDFIDDSKVSEAFDDIDKWYS